MPSDPTNKIAIVTGGVRGRSRHVVGPDAQRCSANRPAMSEARRVGESGEANEQVSRQCTRLRLQAI
jgi:hypothetical protein